MASIAVYGAFTAPEFNNEIYQAGADLARSRHHIFCYGAIKGTYSNLIHGALAQKGQISYVDDKYALTCAGIMNHITEPIKLFYEVARAHLILPGADINDLQKLFQLREQDPKPQASLSPVWLFNENAGNSRRLYEAINKMKFRKEIHSEAFAGLTLATWWEIKAQLKKLNQPRLVVVNT